MRRSGIDSPPMLPPPSFAATGPGISRSHAPLVGKGPGAIALARMPLGPHSTARLCVIAAIPAFDIADGTVNGPPVHTQVVTIDRIDPLCPPSIQRRPAATRSE